MPLNLYICYDLLDGRGLHLFHKQDSIGNIIPAVSKFNN